MRVGEYDRQLALGKELLSFAMAVVGTLYTNILRTLALGTKTP
jgi:hypothetical protein